MGKLSNWLGELKNLRSLGLSYNKLEGPIPTSLCTLQRMEYLYLRGNELNGSLPNCIGQLSQLKELSVYSDQLSGILFEQHFWKLSNLESLDLENFRLNVSSNWVPPFKLRFLYMDSCHIGPAFPAWLQSQKKLQYLSLSNASISSSIPNWFWNISSNLEYLITSFSQLVTRLVTQFVKFSIDGILMILAPTSFIFMVYLLNYFIMSFCVYLGLH